MNLTPQQRDDLQRFCVRLTQECGLSFVLRESTGDILVNTCRASDTSPKSDGVEITLAGAVPFLLYVYGNKEEILPLSKLIATSLESHIAQFNLQQEVMRYESFLDCAADWFWEMDASLHITYLSGRVEEVMGLSASQIIGRNRQEVYHAQEDVTSAKWQHHFQQLENRQAFSNFEIHWVRPDAELRYIELNGSPYFDSNGVFAGYRGTGADITKRKFAEVNFQNLVKGSIQGIYIHRGWHFLFANRAIAKMLGYENVDEFMAQANVENIIAPHEVQRLHAIRIKRERGEKVNARHTADYVRKDGQIITLESINKIVEWNGEPAIQSTVIDVTELKEMTERLQRHRDHLQELVDERTAKLQRSEQRFKTIAETTSEWFWETDEKHHFTFISDRFFQISKVKPDEVMGKTRLEFVQAQLDGAALPSHWAQHQDDLENQRAFEIRYWVNPKSEHPLCIELKGKPVFDGNGVFKGYLGAGTDVTKRVEDERALKKALAEAEKANLAKSDFLSNMSHELRTPLNAILGFSQLLEQNVDGNLVEGQLKSLRHIREGGQHLLELINEILDLSKIEAGELGFEIEDVDLRELLDSCLVYAKALADKYDVVLHDRCGADLPYVRIDGLRMKQVLLNLISNATKYNRNGGDIWLDCDVHKDGFLRLRITDNGLGIAQEDQDKLFKPFHRVGEKRREVEGTGIGLALTKKLIEEMGGRIGFESEAGKGSCFWVDMICADRDDHQERARQSEAVEPLPVCAPAGQYTMLYVEDNSSNLSLMEGIIECVPSLRMISTRTAEEGLEYVKKHTPDIVLLDINLPGMNGVEAVKQMRKMQELEKVPIIAISADAMAGSVDAGLGAGFDRYLTKPLDIPKFMAYLDEVLK